MALSLSGQFMGRILGGGSIKLHSIESRKSLSIKSRKCFMSLRSTPTSPRLFIRGLSKLTTDEMLKEAFAPFGNLVEAKVIVEKRYGISTGCGIVTYNTVEEAKKAHEVMDNNFLEDCTIVVEPRDCEPCQQEQAPSNTCYTKSKSSSTFKRELLAHPSLTKDPQEHFGDLFSCMPWTFIPFSDVAPRESRQSSFGLQEEYPTIFVVESTGMVLQWNTWPIFQDFGALGYPFSDTRINFMQAEDDAAANQPSLKTLLASPQRNYIISSKGEEVPIHTFEDKVVALYFYHVDVANDSLTENFKFAYEELAKNNKKFEVVLVYMTESRFYGRRSHHRESFCKEFETMPWLELPLRDECCKKLRRVFKISNNGIDDPNKLVIIGPNAEFVEPFGASILLQYNIPAYPFTLKKVVELETEKIKELKLEMLWDKNTVFRRNTGLQVSLSELSGKRVMLVLERLGVEHDFDQNSPITKFLLMLNGRYLHTVGTEDEFEVIRIVIDNMGSSTSEQLDLGDKWCLASLLRDLKNINWIVSLASQLKHSLGSCFWYGRSIDEFKYYFPILAFDRDGRLMRKTIYPTFETLEFPFYAGGLEEEMLSQLTTLMS